MVKLLVSRKKALNLIEKSAQEATLSDFIKFAEKISPTLYSDVKNIKNKRVLELDSFFRKNDNKVDYLDINNDKVDSSYFNENISIKSAV